MSLQAAAGHIERLRRVSVKSRPTQREATNRRLLFACHRDLLPLAGSVPGRTTETNPAGPLAYAEGVSSNESSW